MKGLASVVMRMSLALALIAAAVVVAMPAKAVDSGVTPSRSSYPFTRDGGTIGRTTPIHLSLVGVTHVDASGTSSVAVGSDKSLWVRGAGSHFDCRRD